MKKRILSAVIILIMSACFSSATNAEEGGGNDFSSSKSVVKNKKDHSGLLSSTAKESNTQKKMAETVSTLDNETKEKLGFLYHVMAAFNTEKTELDKNLDQLKMRNLSNLTHLSGLKKAVYWGCGLTALVTTAITAQKINNMIRDKETVGSTLVAPGNNHNKLALGLHVMSVIIPIATVIGTLVKSSTAVDPTVDSLFFDNFKKNLDKFYNITNQVTMIGFSNELKILNDLQELNSSAE